MKCWILSIVLAAGLARAQDTPHAEREAARAEREARRAQAEADRSNARREHQRQSEERSRDTYNRGKEDLDRRNYERAMAEFQKVIDAKSARADGALYWKAYALNKLGRRTEALAALEELQKTYPKSGWINDARALAAEVRQSTGQAVSPENQSDEDLKLLAINSLINSDPDRTVPLLQKLLADPKNSPKLKERALFVLAQNHNPKSREILTQIAKGASNPDVQLKAVEYLGVFGSTESRQVLGDVYKSTNDPAVKRAILRSYMISQDHEHLLAAAKSEPDAELRREAIRLLGVAHGQSELAELYATESSPDVKAEILHGLFVGGSVDKLIDLARTEKDPKLRAEAIHLLGISRREQTSAALTSMYASETDKGVKEQIVQALFLQGDAKPLVEIARKESDRDLKAQIVKRLSLMHSKEATDYMMELLAK